MRLVLGVSLNGIIFKSFLLTARRKDLCEQVFDEIIDTIVMKVQRQIDESRRIAKDHDEEPDLHIEVCAALVASRYRC